MSIERFYQLLDKADPTIQQFWNREKHEIVTKIPPSVLESMGTRKNHLLNFLGNVWAGADNYRFCFMEAVKDLDEKDLAIIREWLADPFWP